jgi:hypothetical protein
VANFLAKIKNQWVFFMPIFRKIEEGRIERCKLLKKSFDKVTYNDAPPYCRYCCVKSVFQTIQFKLARLNCIHVNKDELFFCLFEWTLEKKFRHLKADMHVYLGWSNELVFHVCKRQFKNDEETFFFFLKDIRLLFYFAMDLVFKSFELHQNLISENVWT